MGWVILQNIINKVLEERLLLWKIALSHKHPKQKENPITINIINRPKPV